MRDSAEGEWTNLLVTFFYGPLHMDVQVLAVQQEIIYIPSVSTQFGKSARSDGW